MKKRCREEGISDSLQGEAKAMSSFGDQEEAFILSFLSQYWVFVLNYVPLSFDFCFEIVSQ